MGNVIRLHLAPMEGLIDFVFRDLLTSLGGIDQCTTEFIRVTDRLLPDEIFFKYCPELKNGSRTAAGTPVLVQLLGGQVEPLIENAKRAFALGAYGVDFNFGCPAKTVNRHDGGAALLKEPSRIFKILSGVKHNICGSEQKISAKIRLGYEDPSHCLEIAQAVAESGVTRLTVHCRTKMDLYRPPAYWEWIPKIRNRTGLNIIANGDIWTVEDFHRCREITGCEEFMIGRGVIADPFLFQKIKGFTESPRPELRALLPQFFNQSEAYRNPLYAVSRTKQWLAQLSKRNQDLEPLFSQLKILNEPIQFKNQLTILTTNEPPPPRSWVLADT